MRISPSVISISVLAAAAVIAAAAIAAAPATAAGTLSLAPFHAVGLKNGGTVVVRAGANQSVTLVEGDAQHTQFAVHDGSLQIVNCPNDCPRGYRLKVDIVMPEAEAFAVANGGSIRTEGAFREQGSIAAAVHEGGSIDARALAARDVTAAVNEGGSVQVTANRTLTAAVNSGGSIVYWGNPSSVTKAVHNGGSVSHAGAQREGMNGQAPAMAAAPPDGDTADMTDNSDSDDMAESGMDEDNDSDDDSDNDSDD